MGSCLSAEPPELKVAVLGLEGSGKSTLLKQLRIIHGPPYLKEELDNYKEILTYNFLKALQQFIKETPASDMQNPQQTLQIAQEILEQIPLPPGQSLTPGLVAKIKQFWSDSGIQEIASIGELDVSNEYDFFYCLKHLDRFASPDYVPSDTDILHARQRTTGIVPHNFQTKHPKINWKFIDGGGQATERQKWACALIGARVIIFCVAINEFNICGENSDTTMLDEALQVFRRLLNEADAADKLVMVFFNKKDLFRQKLGRMGTTFRDYKGGRNYEQAIRYLRRKFAKGVQQKVYFEDTCALHHRHIQKVFDRVFKTVITERLRQSEI